VVAEQLQGKVKAVASVLGGVTTADLQQAYPGVPAFRLLPNTPVEIGRGVVCYVPAEGKIDERLEADVLALFGRLGTVVTLPESQIEVANAVMGVAPAYMALVVEAQVEAAVRLGLRSAVASRLVGETMAGSAAWLEAGGYDTLAARRAVTSPGGSTARGLAALEREGLRTAFAAAADAVVFGEGR
jgi:pyrroline-5-carboxylate reductase